MDRVSLGKAGLQGWHARAADALASPVARRSPLSQDQVQALVGAAFFALSLLYVAGTIRRMAAGGGPR